MKKLFSLVLILAMAIFLVACNESSTEPVESTANKKGEEQQDAKKEEKAPEVNEVVAENDIIKISYRGTVIDDSAMGKEGKILFDIENKSDKTVTVQERELSIDDAMVDETTISFSTTVAAQKVAKKSALSILDFEGYEFPEFKKNAEMNLVVIDDETFDELGTFPITINFEQ